MPVQVPAVVREPRRTTRRPLPPAEVQDSGLITLPLEEKALSIPPFRRPHGFRPFCPPFTRDRRRTVAPPRIDSTSAPIASTVHSPSSEKISWMSRSNQLETEGNGSTKGV